MCYIPHHDSAEALELARVFDHIGELVGWNVSGAGGLGTCRDTNDDLDIFVLGDCFGPVIPFLKVVLRALGIFVKSVDAAEVVIELHPDSIDINGTIQDILVCLIGVRALGGSSQEVLSVGLFFDQRTQLVGEGGHMRDGGLEVEVESIEGNIIKRTLDFRALLDRSEGLPHELCSSLCVILVLEAALAVGRTANG